MGTLKTITGKDWGIVAYDSFAGKKFIICDWSEKNGLPELKNDGISWDGNDIIYSDNPKLIKSVLEYYKELSINSVSIVSGQMAQEWYNKKDDSEGLVYFFKKKSCETIIVIVCI